MSALNDAGSQLWQSTAKSTPAGNLTALAARTRLFTPRFLGLAGFAVFLDAVFFAALAMVGCHHFAHPAKAQARKKD